MSTLSSFTIPTSTSVGHKSDTFIDFSTSYSSGNMVADMETTKLTLTYLTNSAVGVENMSD